MKPHALMGVLAAFLCLPALASESAIRSTYKERQAEVSEASKAAYLKGLSWYDSELAQRPFDVALAVERCEYMEGLASDEDGEEWNDDLYEDAEQCLDALEAKFPAHPEVELARLARMYGDALTRKGEAILNDDLSMWTPSQLAQIHADLARAYDGMGKAAAGEHALAALRSDATADTRVVAAKWLLKAGERQRALEILTSPLDRHERTDVTYTAQRMDLFAKLGDRAHVLQEYAVLGKAQSGWRPASVSQSLLAVGAIDEARLEFERANKTKSLRSRTAAFLFEFEHGGATQAFEAYEDMRNSDGFKSDPMMQYRLSLLAKSATLPWRARDATGLGVVFLIFAAGALLTLVPISFVHYRGLVRQLHDAKPSDPMASWKLRHAWFAMFALFAAGSASLYFVGPIPFPDGWDWTKLNLTVQQNGTALLVQDVMLLVLLAPLAISARTRGYLWSQHWPYAKGLLIAAGLALLLRIPTLIAVSINSYRHFVAKDALPGIMQVLLSMRTHYGFAAAFLIAAVIAPICEEFIFRGVLLGAFSSRISFIAANVLQAALFTALHFTSEGIPILFILAVLAGVLAKRSGGLLAPIVLHATFNAIAFVAVVLSA